MSETNGTSRDLSYLDKLDTDELEELLLQDSLLDESEDSDVDVILYTMEVLARREKENGHSPNVESALRSFRDNYYPCISDAEPLMSFDDPNKDEVPATTEGKSRDFKTILKPLSIAAIIVFVLLTGTITSYALGFDLWGVFAAWTHETFGFMSGAAASDTLPFPNLRTALDMYGVDADGIVPSWLPGDLSEDTVQASESPSGHHIVSKCMAGSKEISMEIKIAADPNMIHRTYEILDADVEIYATANNEYYITSNGGAARLTWISENIECSLLGDFNSEDLYKMIDSIKGG